MQASSLLEEYGILQERLRILILQHRSEEMDYDDHFLQEMQAISRQLLTLKKQIRSAKAGPFVLPVNKKNTGRFSHYQ
ncbi:hypothetical protein DRI50_03270 [candidate division KSB1 bacterium]|jgi:hypothetical protein|nr:MAG: hypothetical protein DRI50_03270 [candidate division KSB1 bacterium]